MVKAAASDTCQLGSLTRRSFLAGGASTVLVSGLIGSEANAQTVVFDYYISPTGNDANPGTQAQPWAITAINTQRVLYAGKRVGLLPGTYDVSQFQQTAAAVLLQVASGTAASPTVIQSVTPRAAILTAKVGTTYFNNGNIIGSGANGVGSNPYVQYITIKDLVITGTNSGAISFNATGYVASCPGIVIEGCVIYDVVNPDGSANKGGISLGTALKGAVVRNCLIYDCYQAGIPRNSHGNAAGIYDWAISTVIEYCTIYDCQCAVYQKNQMDGPPQGEIFRFNYVYTKTAGMSCVFSGFNNAFGTTPPYSPTTVYGNVFENASSLHHNSNDGTTALQADWNFYNNTIWTDGTGNNWCWGTMIESAAAIAAGCRVNIYNNITVRPAGLYDVARGDVAVAPGGWGTFNYNTWPSDACFGLSTSDPLYPTSLINLAQWKVANPGVEVNGLAGVPSFVGSLTRGGGALQYALSSTSLGKGAGRVGGAAAGAVVDMGAWGSGATKIGCDFSTTTVVAPKPPALTVG